MRKFVSLLLLPVVGVGLAACGNDAPRDSKGQVTSSAKADVFQLKVGDCTGSFDNLSSIEDVKLIPCAQAHYYEAYAATKLTDASFPGDAAVKEKSRTFCRSEFQKFIGVSVDNSKYESSYLFPSKESWDSANDREIICLVGSDKGGIKGTLKGIRK